MTKLTLLLSTAALALSLNTADAARLCNLTDLLYGTCERGGGFERSHGERGGKSRGEAPGNPEPDPETPKGDNGNHYGNDKPDNNDRDDKNKHDGEQTKGDHHDNNGKPDDKPGKGNGKK